MAENTTPKRLTKVQTIAELAQKAEVDKKTAERLLNALADLAAQQLGDDGPGEFTIPGVVRMKTIAKPATKDRQGINPFTKEPMLIRGKPASKKVRVTPVKCLKELVQ